MILISCNKQEAQQINACKEKIEQHIKAHPKIQNGIYSVEYKLSKGEVKQWMQFKVTKFELFMSGQLSKIYAPPREYFGKNKAYKGFDDLRIQWEKEELERDQKPFKELGFNISQSISAEVNVGCMLAEDGGVSVIQSDGPYGLHVLRNVR